MYMPLFSYAGKITVLCNQTQKLHQVEASRLSLEGGEELTEKHTAVGSQVLLEVNRRTYPVTVLPALGTNQEGPPKQKKVRHLSDSEEVS